MSQPPAQPKVFHITHATNVAGIVANGLWSDKRMQSGGGLQTAVGMSAVKARRMRLPVSRHPGTVVGDYVPFNFCPRSVMLYILHKGNHRDLTYTDGEGPMVHLQADFHAVVRWASAHGRPWALSTGNAAASYAQFYSNVGDLVQIDWGAVANNDFRDRAVREAKQAEFLLHEVLPWQLVEHIGVHSMRVAQQIQSAFGNSTHRPDVTIERSWYYF